MAQLAIKWVMQFPGITAPIVGGRTDKQVLENVGACGWKMEQSDFEKINTLSKDFWRQMPHYNHFFDTAVIEQK
ncbi:MAG: aldo/keto reductase [[Clostridium] leptum]